MDTITTPAGQYTVPATSIVHNAQVSLTDRSPASIVHLTQYDTTMPIIAVALTANGQPYTVPSGAAVNVRLAKPDGTFVYNPALGISEDAQTAYIGTTVQMTTVWGRLNAIVEVVLNGAVAGTGIFILDITANPVPESAIESTSEFLTIQQIAAQVQQAADLLEQQSTNLQNLTDNLEAVQGAASNALAAKNAAEEAKQAAQQALGFRTFFDAISPDANGSLDPSRPMTTAAAQASWTVNSKGDRIQSVQVNGSSSFPGKYGKKIPVPTSGWQEAGSGQNIFYLAEVLPIQASYKMVCSIGKTLGEGYSSLSSFQTDAAGYTWAVGTYTQASGTASVTGRLIVKAPFDSASAFMQWLNQSPQWVIYQSDSESDSPVVYVAFDGAKYTVYSLPITEALGAGDNVQSNVPSGCDQVLTLNGGSGESWQQNGSNGAYNLSIENFPLASENLKAITNYLPQIPAAQTYSGQVGFSLIISSRQIQICLEGGASPASYLPEHPLSVYFQTSAYNEQVDITVSLETHANGNAYAHDPVTLEAVPYTEADATAAQQMAATPSTLPYIDSADVPMMLDAAEPTAAAAPLASTLPVAGTYVVSSQDGTTVAVTLKAFQDGGDAATLGGMTAVEAMLNFVYPVGSIYMSANNVSPQTFLGGTWQQIQGQFLLAASGSYPAGSTGGAAQQTLATENIAAHNHGPAAGERFLSIGGATNGALVSPGTGVMDVEWNANWATADTGSGEPFSIMPPYLAVYMWQRTE